MTIQTITTWLAVTDETMADADAMRPWLMAWMEYSALPECPLTPDEQATGWRDFTARSGYVLRVRVGWRQMLFDALRDFAREAWPEDYADDDD